MNSNEQLIQTFYSCFKNKDFEGMNACYAEHVKFSDEVFLNLNQAQVSAMWEMLLTRSKDLSIDIKHIEANEQGGRAEWVACYTFSTTNRQVINHVSAKFVFADGKIEKHTDYFDFYAWARQAFGLKGFLLGWTDSFKSKVRKAAAKSLERFMKRV